MTLHTPLFTQRLALLNQEPYLSLLGEGLRGIERETLRVQTNGQLNTEPHPVALGSALTHPFITTDYSESLLEFITPAVASADLAVQKLQETHHYTYSQLGAQRLWSASMPPNLPSETDIPIAWYGSSHLGMLKHVYRRGLALRYGKAMQCIAGIHYNFSLNEALWPLITANDTALTPSEQQSEGYIALIRNFHRYSWLLMYLFGASPALSASFLKNQAHELQTLNEETLYLPEATSLRMSDLGYQNNAQDGLMPPYNTLKEYMTHLGDAVRKPYAPYEALGLKRGEEWWQINTNVLQIENEFYATIRPKRVTKKGETPIEALCRNGIQYVEVRCLDIDPFSPIGIRLETAHFLDVFLTYLALSDSPLTNTAEERINHANFALTVKEGRKPNLALTRGQTPVALSDWGLELLTAMQAVADLLDKQSNTSRYSDSLAAQRPKLHDSSLTPSAQVLASIQQHQGSFAAFGWAQSQRHAQFFADMPLPEALLADYQTLAAQSLQEQTQLEAVQTGSFDDFMADYRARTVAKPAL